ncbi:MAG: chemotaxis protein CheB, partial [Proteobacteria bacterium]|nr:chemotaxis protein CheB [Pseudomonadota bacterium]
LGDSGCALRLSREPVVNGNMPSVDPMLSSLADVFGARLLAVVLSGMGRDGLEGAEAVRRAGGTVVVQDEASSVVWGMPGAVAGAGHADAVMPPEAIGEMIAAQAR